MTTLAKNILNTFPLGLRHSETESFSFCSWCILSS